jgi:2-polyprenyl-3-methyl-5-hydroxy-6-metoxy-1,4-benzoquinol methylase
MTGSHEFGHLNDSVRDIWDDNASFWDQRMGEGNRFHNTLVRPPQERLLDIQPGDLVLDVACGNGNFARQMADLGARVVEVDLAPRMIEHAIDRSADYGDRVQFHASDATDQEAIVGLGEGTFDAVVCTMAIMDMARIEPLAGAVARLLKPRGRFVFSLLHPAFNSPDGLTRAVERVEHGDGTITEHHSVKISHYIRPHAFMGIAMIDQPRPQHYFHRPMGVLLSVFFEEGFVADGIEEPVFDDQPAEDVLNWDSFTEIPPVLVVRLRPRSSRSQGGTAPN